MMFLGENVMHLGYILVVLIKKTPKIIVFYYFMCNFVANLSERDLTLVTLMTNQHNYILRLRHFL